MKRKLFVALLSLAVVGFLYYLFFIRLYEVAPHKEFSAKVRLLRAPVTGETRIIDAETGKWTMFTYYDSFGVTLEDVEKLPNGEWKVTLKDSRK